MRKIPGGTARIHRTYYDPGKSPKPRALPDGGQELHAHVVKETRQLRRKREREERQGK